MFSARRRPKSRWAPMKIVEKKTSKTTVKKWENELWKKKLELMKKKIVEKKKKFELWKFDSTRDSPIRSLSSREIACVKIIEWRAEA